MSTAVQPSSRLGELLDPLRERPVRLLWSSQLISELGDWAARIAVTSLVYQRTDSPVMAAAAFVAGLVPWLGPGQLLAALADRYGRRGLMVSADLVRAAAFLVIGLVAMPAWGVLAMTALAGLATPPFEAARSAALVEYSSSRRLSAAIRLSSATQDLGTLLGYAAGGLALTLTSPAGACLLNAGTFTVSALLVVSLPAALARAAGDAGSDEDAGPAEGPLVAVRRAAAALWSDPLLRAATWLGVLPVATGTALSGQVVPWAQTAFPERGWVSGAVLAAMSAVCLLVTLAVRPAAEPPRTLRLAGSLTAAAALATAALCLVPGPAAVAVALVASGCLFVPIVLAQTVIAPRLAPERRAASFGLLMGALTLAQTVVSPLVGGLVTVTGTARALQVTGVATAALAALVLAGPALRAGRPHGIRP